MSPRPEMRLDAKPGWTAKTVTKRKSELGGKGQRITWLLSVLPPGRQKLPRGTSFDTVLRP